MKPLDGLLRSYLDLGNHFDPAAASAAGLVSADARLGAFDAQSMREHVAAFRAIAAAIEDLDLEDLEDEIDRTALLADVRTRIARFEQERPQVREPGFWLAHARQAIGALLERPGLETVAPAALARIAALPGLLDAARMSIRRPPVVLVDAALLDLGPTGELLVRAAAELAPGLPGGLDRLNAAVGAALQALARFGTALRDEIEPEADWSRAALGLELFERRLQEAYTIRASPAELAHWAERTLDDAARRPPSAAARGLVAAQDRAIAASGSEVRRAIRSPVSVEGWRLYASGVGHEDDPAWQAHLRLAAARLVADVGLHTEGMTPAAATELLHLRGGLPADAATRDMRAIAAHPTSGAAAAAGFREIERLWDAFAARQGPDRDAFHAALLRYGALAPELAAWGMGLDA